MNAALSLPLATYMAQLVFVKTFSHQNKSGIRKFSEVSSKSSQVQLPQQKPGSLSLPTLNQT